MENVLAAVVIIFLLLFGGLTMSSAFISAQETIITASQAVTDRANDIAGTDIKAVDLKVIDSGSVIEVTVRNDGDLKLADFSQWDLFTEYYDSSATPVYHAGRLPYDATGAIINAWSLDGIYLDAANDLAEGIEPNILNPGEEVVLRVRVVPAIGVGQSAAVTIATQNGVTTALTGKRNTPPLVIRSYGVRVANHGSALLTNATLQTIDIENSADQLTYTITTPPAQGALTPADSFTQAQIDAGEVYYTHTGDGDDSFEFTVSDGIDTIGTYSYAITLNQPPERGNNAGLTLPANSTAVITSDLLSVTDADDPSDKLIYTVTQFPANGTLSLGSTFSQADIDNLRLTYTHTGVEADLFKFVVTDGYDVIGTDTFYITLVP